MLATLPGEKLAMWLPDWLYNALPFIYAAIGTVAIYFSDRPSVHGPGLLLILIALYILKLRRDYRAASNNCYTKKR
jgi:hypothetical protein